MACIRRQVEKKEEETQEEEEPKDRENANTNGNEEGTELIVLKRQNRLEKLQRFECRIKRCDRNRKCHSKTK